MSSPVFIVTGASKGIGKAIALQSLTKFNARVVAVARSAELLDALKADATKLGKHDALELLVGDVTSQDVARHAVSRALDKWGQLNAVIANAGVLEPIATVAESPVEGWKHLFDVNFFSVITLVQEALPALRKSKGAIIMVSSGAASKGYRAWGAYGASKAAMNHLAETLSAEEPDIATIAVRPGIVDTDMQGLIRSNGQEAMKDDHKKFVELHEAGKLVRPEEPGHVLAALAAKAPLNLSGTFVSWDDEELKEYRA
ncbi:hypothetical protein BCR43DRAFT_476111 [Syncephalastrum racemosum]|uniref:Ketoreductase domain-containing protein n=1 Tax=Syncephalastrum racemosum TaxID=13706 RepID=A0A1X2H750_SYNRA|nr:hypothetical protein BCR43DRAFT_476111 [Syncephalastrum racemosum]